MYNMYSAMHIIIKSTLHKNYYTCTCTYMYTRNANLHPLTHFSSDGQNVDSIVDLLQFVDGLDNRSTCGY